ncbi:RNA pyrophosphohydrolase [Thalassospiraceae bacterium LMO-SO8]|nr:RNA pyrophosphohydrolase [Alphaproteobacteria bacterium LMO-S08]WND76645.1 RNA pyrophosphohydrolase [Thalassospiraceae bacterium LMO-SO8]
MTDPDDDPRPYRLGVGVLLLNDASRVWLGERIRRTGQQMDYPWQLPQGGLDEGEDPRDAVFRELEEETGTAKAEIIAETPDWLTYDLPADVRDRVWKGRFRGQRQKWYALRFLGEDGDFDLNTHHKPEFSQWRWAPLADLPALVVPFKRGLYHDLLAAFGHLDGEIGSNNR